MESSNNLNINIPIKNLVTLATFETVPGRNGISVFRSALPADPTQVPALSCTSNEIPGRPFALYFLTSASNSACFGCVLLLSTHGISWPFIVVSSICGLTQLFKDRAAKTKKGQ